MVKKDKVSSIVRHFFDRVKFYDLPPGVRQTIFSFLPTCDLIQNIDKLNKETRELVANSAIVRENKGFRLNLRTFFGGQCILHQERASSISQSLSTLLPKIDRLEILIG